MKWRLGQRRWRWGRATGTEIGSPLPVVRRRKSATGVFSPDDVVGGVDDVVFVEVALQAGRRTGSTASAYVVATRILSR